MKNLKVLEWNINMRSNNNIEIPTWVLEEIVKKEPDIIVLVEYKNGVENDKILNDFLEENIGKYIIQYYDPQKPKTNGILIAVRNKYFDSAEIVDSQEKYLSNKEHPNWLLVKATLINNNDGDSIDIIGVRTRVGRSETSGILQFKTFLNKMDTVSQSAKKIIIGDFNYGPHITDNVSTNNINWQDFIEMIRKMNYLKVDKKEKQKGLGLEIYSPYSPSGTSYKDRKLDWLLLRGFQVKKSDYNQLDWSFGANNNRSYTTGYMVPEGYFIRTDPGYPDHAMFTVELADL